MRSAWQLADHVVGGRVLALAQVGGVTQDAVAGQLAEADLHDEVRLDPPGDPGHRPRWWRLEGADVGGAGVEQPAEPTEPAPSPSE